jgi:hypothetical protein
MTCTECLIDKAETDFELVNSRGKTYRRKQCRECRHAKTNSKQRGTRKRDPVKDRENKTKWDRRRRWKSYGLDPIEIEARLAAHDNKCELCLETIKGIPCVDHCHTELKFRGIICHNCNTGLGHFKDSPRLLLLAIDYLNRSR